MLQFLSEAGPVVFPLMLLAGVIVVLATWNGLALLVKKTAAAGRRRHSIDGILFWGSVAAILGFLGQWIGVMGLARSIAQQGVVNPQLVVFGLSESLWTPVFGMVVFTVSAFLWFFLRIGLWSVERRA